MAGKRVIFLPTPSARRGRLQVNNSTLEGYLHSVDLRCTAYWSLSHPPMLIRFIEFVAALAAALFAGAALYINVAEHPSRMGLETRMAALQWAPSYKRATWLQAPLAILSLFGGIAVWLLGGGWGWLVAAVLVGAVVPFTFVIIMPINHKLLASDRDLSSSETRELLIRWGRLHAVRTLLSLAAAMVYFWCMLRP